MTTAFAPGRVNLIGEHTDYNDGLSLPFAIGAGITVAAQRADHGHVEVEARDLGERDRFALADPRAGDGVAGWRAYPRGMVGELLAAGIEVPAARLTISGDLPGGSGLSSSAALEGALALALLALAQAPEPDRVELARLCARVENDWAGARTGLLDQLAALLGREGAALRIDFRTLEVSPVPFELHGWRLVVADSGERHEHSGGGYNERRAQCEEAARLLGVDSLRDAPDPGDRLPDVLARRVRHVRAENARVDKAVRALGDGDLPALAALLDASHASLRDDFEVSTPAVERTVEALREAGAAGARIMGGGFGGSVLALFPPDVAPPAEAIEVAPHAGARLVG